jgi:hypothetical protein
LPFFLMSRDWGSFPILRSFAAKMAEIAFTE